MGARLGVGGVWGSMAVPARSTMTRQRVGGDEARQQRQRGAQRPAWPAVWARWGAGLGQREEQRSTPAAGARRRGPAPGAQGGRRWPAASRVGAEVADCTVGGEMEARGSRRWRMHAVLESWRLRIRIS
jgi:hypothetical protein